MIGKTVLAVVLAAAPMAAQDVAIPFAESFQARGSNRDGGKDDPDYQKGLGALDAHQWDDAIEAFEASAARKASTAAAALYWEAYAQNRAGLRSEALSTITELQKAYATSRWLNDARALSLEIRAQAGAPVSPAAEPDEELKLVALNSLMTSDPNQALPILQKLLAGNSSGKIKEKALFVLVQNPTPEAAKLIDNLARGKGDPELQLKAIHYLGMMGGDEARQELASIYKSAESEEVKRSILRGFMISGSRSFLLDVAKTEKNPALRQDAIRQLALSGGQDELWQLYQSESSVENRKAILKSMFLGGNSARLADVARDEKDPALRAAAIKSLGLMGENGRGDLLVSIYRSDTNPEVRHAILQSLFLQQNGKALVDLARAEKDPQMKQEIVHKMSLVHSKEVTDYMMEILK